MLPRSPGVISCASWQVPILVTGQCLTSLSARAKLPHFRLYSVTDTTTTISGTSPVVNPYHTTSTTFLEVIAKTRSLERERTGPREDDKRQTITARLRTATLRRHDDGDCKPPTIDGTAQLHYYPTTPPSNLHHDNKPGTYSLLYP